MTMNIINRLKRAAWSPFKTFVGAIMARGFGVYSYPPASPEPVRLDSHCVLARVGMDSDPFGVTDKGPLFLADNERQSRSTMNTLCSQKALRAAGERPTVIALYAAAGSPEQRRPLAERLRLRYRVLAPDLYGDAVGCALGAHPPLSLEAEAARIEPLLDAFPGPVYLVAHGYGAAVALKLAYRRRERIGGLVLYFADPGSRYVVLDILVLRRMPELCAQLDAQFADPTPLAEYARIDAPVRLLTGARTRAANERIAELLAGTLPRAEWRRVDSADWMGPGARDEAVDREIEGFLAQQQANWHCDPEPTVVFGRPVFRCRAHARECAEAVSLSGPAPCPAPLGTRGEDRL